MPATHRSISSSVSSTCPAITVLIVNRLNSSISSPPTILTANPTLSTLTCGIVRMMKPIPTRITSTIASVGAATRTAISVPALSTPTSTSSGGPTDMNPPIGIRSNVPARIMNVISGPLIITNEVMPI